jgi:hypothetical protein
MRCDLEFCGDGHRRFRNSKPLDGAGSSVKHRAGAGSSLSRASPGREVPAPRQVPARTTRSGIQRATESDLRSRLFLARTRWVRARKTAIDTHGILGYEVRSKQGARPKD